MLFWGLDDLHQLWRLHGNVTGQDLCVFVQVLFVGGLGGGGGSCSEEKSVEHLFMSSCSVGYIIWRFVFSTSPAAKAMFSACSVFVLSKQTKMSAAVLEKHLYQHNTCVDVDSGCL